MSKNILNELNAVVFSKKLPPPPELKNRDLARPGAAAWPSFHAVSSGSSLSSVEVGSKHPIGFGVF